jgi:hypothetical protein
LRYSATANGSAHALANLRRPHPYKSSPCCLLPHKLGVSTVDKTRHDFDFLANILHAALGHKNTNLGRKDQQN